MVNRRIGALLRLPLHTLNAERAHFWLMKVTRFSCSGTNNSGGFWSELHEEFGVGLRVCSDALFCNWPVDGGPFSVSQTLCVTCWWELALQNLFPFACLQVFHSYTLKFRDKAPLRRNFVPTKLIHMLPKHQRRFRCFVVVCNTDNFYCWRDINQ